MTDELASCIDGVPICKALGLDEMRIKRLTLDISAGELMSVTTESFVIGAEDTVPKDVTRSEAALLATVLTQYYLVPKDS